MSSIFLIYENQVMKSAASNKQIAVNLIKSIIPIDRLSDVRVEQFSLNDMYNHNKETEYTIDSNYQLHEAKINA